MRGQIFRRRTFVIGGVVLLAVVVAGLLAWRVTRAPDVPTLAFSDFLQQVDQGQVSAVTIAPEGLRVERPDGHRARTIAPPGYVAGNPTFVTMLARHHVRVTVESGAAPDPVTWLLLGLVVAVVGGVGFVAYRSTAGRVAAIESRVAQADPHGAVVTFNDVAGVDEAKDELKGIVEFLREPQKFSVVGGRVPKGVLLVGPPGTGKTLLARSMAGEAGVPFLFASGSDFVEMYAGVGAARVRKLFKDARRHAACIVFIDELDAVGRTRGGHSLSHEEREQTLNQLLVEMDGFAPNRGIVVIGATNRHDILDPALLRPGRFDRQVHVGNPDMRGREAILRVHARRVAIEPGVDLRAIARGTPGFSGAELANLINEAALLAVQAGRAAVTTPDLEAARDKVMMGAERRSLAMSERERATCAIHEAGHAVVAALLPEADPLHKVTIVPRGGALGITMQLPEDDRHTHSREYLEAQLAVLMGGRVAEELFLEQVTSGASNDIERATAIARRMVCEFGMSPLGPLAFRTSGDPLGRPPAGALSEATAELVDAEIRELVMRACGTARQLLDRHRPAVQAVADELLASESIDADGVRALLATAMLPPDQDRNQARAV
ncbi:MAG: ATP-dependent zinc metalloprotease FtsH [Acidobacteriota bacterium]|nr:ATP-dependent zinc metalloprotease FtsH [Acidobacteriota bacterium]